MIGKPILKSVAALIPDPLYARLRYLMYLGYWPNTAHPRDINDYVLGRMFGPRDPLMAQTADKWAVRDYVRKTIGAEHLNPAYLCASDPADILLSKLPQTFVMKPTHASGYYKLVEDKAAESEAELQALATKWMKLDYYRTSREWVYKDMPKAVLFEENLCRNGRTPTDYKFYIANGHCFILYIDVDRNSGLKETHYDRNWVALPFTSDGFPLAENVEPPDNLAEMMELAEELAAPFEFARVDMYSVDDRILFGEITHFPASGKSLYVPRSAGVDMLSMLKEALRSPRKAPRDGVAAGAN